MVNITPSVPYDEAPFELQEHKELEITDCPPTIRDGLEAAAFEKTSDPEWEYAKKHETTSGGENKVVKVRIEGQSAFVEARSNAGMISFTPETTLTIEPKIGWASIVEMLLTVYEHDQSVEYHGIPLEDFLSEDIELKDVFVLLAINYLKAFQEVKEKGLIRDLQVRRESVSGEVRGDIDIERQLTTITEPTEHHCIYTETEYDIPVNSLFHAAGVHLLRTYDMVASSDDAELAESESLGDIMARVHTEVERMEGYGIDSTPAEYSMYTAFSLSELPQQREYYEEAIEVSQSILSSSLGRKIGPQELTVDFLLNMNDLFEEYTQVRLEQILADIKKFDYYNEISDVQVKHEPKYPVFRSSQPFKGDPHHKPDHVLVDTGGESPYEGLTGEVIAVMDSKYYKTRPLKKPNLRHQLLAYRELTATDYLAFVTPEAKQLTHTTHSGAAVAELGCTEAFNLDAFDATLRQYVEDRLFTRETRTPLHIFAEARENTITRLVADKHTLTGTSGRKMVGDDLGDLANDKTYPELRSEADDGDVFRPELFVDDVFHILRRENGIQTGKNRTQKSELESFVEDSYTPPANGFQTLSTRVYLPLLIEDETGTKSLKTYVLEHNQSSNEPRVSVQETCDIRLTTLTS